jgi:hypothetical protein
MASHPLFKRVGARSSGGTGGRGPRIRHVLYESDDGKHGPGLYVVDTSVHPEKFLTGHLSDRDEADQWLKDHRG